MLFNKIGKSIKKYLYRLTVTNHQYSVVGFLLPKNRTNEGRAEIESRTNKERNEMRQRESL